MEKIRKYDGRPGRRTGLKYDTAMVVYALRDPRDDAIRYIGITNNLLERFNQHLRLNGPNTRKHDWLREILDVHMLPAMVTLEVVDATVDARKRETAWIRVYQESGADLLNHLPQLRDDIDRLIAQLGKSSEGE